MENVLYHLNCWMTAQAAEKLDGHMCHMMIDLCLSAVSAFRVLYVGWRSVFVTSLMYIVLLGSSVYCEVSFWIVKDDSEESTVMLGLVLFWRQNWWVMQEEQSGWQISIALCWVKKEKRNNFRYNYPLWHQIHCHEFCDCLFSSHPWAIMIEIIWEGGLHCVHQMTTPWVP